MQPIYKFVLSVDGDGQQAFPIFKDDISIEFQQQSNEQFFRRKLSGKLTFLREDYQRIVSAAFDADFIVDLFISYDGGTTWQEYWEGTFWKTDCEFNVDDQSVIVQPTMRDEYDDVIAGLDKEFDLITLAPQIQPVKLDKRPMIQIYIPGQTTIGCFLSGMWWEQECEAVSNDNTLRSTYHFANMVTQRVAEVTSQNGSELPAFIGDTFSLSDVGTHSLFSADDEYELRIRVFDSGPLRLTNISLWQGTELLGSNQWPNVITLPWEFTLNGEIGSVTFSIRDLSIYARVICDVETIGTSNTYPLGTNDMVKDNRNYSRVIPYDYPDTIFFGGEFSETPTQWGLYQPGKYYKAPDLPPSLGIGELFPISRNAWTRLSYWFTFPGSDWFTEQLARAEFTLKDAYPLDSVISVLLAQIAPGITHQPTTDYSRFLYGTNPITGINQRLFITPKSNLISSGYDQPAQKAPITLATITKMLRDCFRCYWYIEDEKFKIEHIRYFNNGGSYSGTPDVGIDLTTQGVSRNGKKWAFGTSKYSFEKPDMTARYQFGWMDDVTQLFEGFPIDIVSRYVNPDKIENIEVSQFTSDVDYILLNPAEISKDGFVLLGAVLTDGEYKLPYYNFNFNSTDHILQNAYVAFIYLQQYYFWDMPARQFKINNVTYSAYGIKKLKMQTLRFPCLQDPNLLKLVKTNLGNGMVQKLSLNLSSRMANATLKYDTE